MKTFRFRLERVLSWRETQLSLAEAKVEHLKGGLRTTDEAMARVVERRAAAHATVTRATLVSGAELGALEASRVWAVGEEKRLAVCMVVLQQSIEVQNRYVAEARRGVKVVERLKERQFKNWKTEVDHEIDGLAAEAAIAQWRRLNRR
jgi:hypothetical protein